MDEQSKQKTKEKFYIAVLIMYALAIGALFWNQFRPRLVLSQCSETALQSSQSYFRNSLPTDNTGVKSYEELLNECLQEFGF